MALENLLFLEAKRKATQSSNGPFAAQGGGDFLPLPTTGASQGPTYSNVVKTNTVKGGNRNDNNFNMLNVSVKFMDSNMISFLCEVIDWFRSDND